MGKIYNIILNSSNTSSYTVDVPTSLASLTYKCDLGIILCRHTESYRKSYKLTWKLRSVQVSQVNFEPLNDLIALYVLFDGIRTGYNITSDLSGNLGASNYAGVLNLIYNGGNDTTHRYTFETNPSDNPPIYFENMYNNCYNIQVQFKNMATLTNELYLDMVNYNLILSLEEQ
jgi:hypothetical protein